MKKLMLLFAFFSILGMQVYAQKTVTGTVTDEAGDGIPGASVQVKGTTILTMTVSDGTYSIEVPDESNTLVFSYIGMEKQEIVIVGNVVDVTISPSSEDIEEVIVIAYGTTQKSSFTGSVGIVDSEDLGKISTADFLGSMQGTIAGLNVTTSSGQPGAQSTVRIRGIGSLNASSAPLYVIDGVPVTSGNYSSVASSDYGTSSSILSTLNPDDIENISVLKDATASSLYGSRAANGVILITTKSGKEGKTVFSVKAKYGITDIAVPMPEVLGAQDYFKVFWDDNHKKGVEAGLTGQALADFANTSTINQFNINPFSSVSPYDENGNLTSGTSLYWDEDWRDAIIQQGTVQDYAVSASGGTETTTFYISGGFHNNKGNVVGSDLERYSGKFNIKSQVKDYLKVGINTMISFTDLNTPPGSGGGAAPMSFVNNVSNIFPLYEHDADGNVLYDSQGNPIYNYFNATQLDFNPVALAELDIYEAQTYRALNSVFLEFSFLKDFSFKTVPSFDYISVYETRYYNPEHGNGASPNGRSAKYSKRDRRFNLTNTLNWAHTYGNHGLSVLLGNEVASSQYDYFYAAGTNFPFPGNSHLIAAGEISGINSYVIESNLESYFSRVNYDLNNKYYLSGGIRYDGSSRFGPDNKWGLFYSVGASWRISQEDFMSSLTWLDNLKLRASTGTQGNDNIDDYAHLGLFELGANYGGNSGLEYTQLANPTLRWEKSKLTDIGLEFGFFNIISGEIDFYIKESDDLLYERPLSYTTGFADIMSNVASMKNSGFEVQLHSENIQTKDFSWTTDFNISAYKNEITEMSQEELLVGSKRWIVGQDRYQFFIREWAGVDPSTGEPMWYMDILDTDDEPTGDRTVTKNWDDATRYEQGSALPTFTGGFQNTAIYKGIEFSFNMFFSYGGKILDYTQMDMMHAGAVPGQQMSADILDAWQAPGDITDVPRFYANNVDNGNERSSRFLHDNNYIRFRNITLAYNFPSSLLKKAGMSSLRAYVSLENYFTFASYEGSDPEVALDGTTNNYYPHTKGLMFGLNFNF